MVKRGKILIDVNDIVGKRLGKLEVVEYISMNYDMTAGGERLRHYYKVVCDCGNVKILQRGPLLNEIVHSCGCVRRGARYGNKNEK